MNTLAVEIGLVIVFILIGGGFSAAEIALISLRDSQIRALAETRGARGRRLARLVSDPNRFLAAVQIGVTVATMLSSAFGAATIAGRVSGALIDIGMAPGAADPVALVATTLVIAFVSLVLGELAPKRLGLQRSESIALAASAPLAALATLFRPVVWLLGVCTNGAVRVLGGDPRATGGVMSEEELQGLVAAHESLSTVERRMISDVFAAEDTLVREVMVPRLEVEFLPASMTLSRAAKQVAGKPHSRFPVTGRDVDEVVGVVHITSILAPTHPLGRAATIGDVAGAVMVLPGTKAVLDALTEMRRTGQHLAVIADEYGGTDGIVTVEDLLEEIVGEMYGEPGGPVSEDAGGPGTSGEVDGLTNLDDFAEETGIVLDDGPYDTVAGFMMARLGRLPELGDSIVIEVPAPAPGPGSAEAPLETDTAATDGADNDAPTTAAGEGPGSVTVRLVAVAMDGRRVERIAVVRDSDPGAPALGIGDGVADGKIDICPSPPPPSRLPESNPPQQ